MFRKTIVVSLVGSTSVGMRILPSEIYLTVLLKVNLIICKVVVLSTTKEIDHSYNTKNNNVCLTACLYEAQDFGNC